MLKFYLFNLLFEWFTTSQLLLHDQRRFVNLRFCFEVLWWTMMKETRFCYHQRLNIRISEMVLIHSIHSMSISTLLLLSCQSVCLCEGLRQVIKIVFPLAFVIYKTSWVGDEGNCQIATYPHSTAAHGSTLLLIIARWKRKAQCCPKPVVSSNSFEKHQRSSNITVSGIFLAFIYHHLAPLQTAELKQP